jgi:hypothetical protein
MDKVLRNVIIFAAVVLMTAAVFAVVAVSKDTSDNTSGTTVNPVVNAPSSTTGEVRIWS